MHYFISAGEASGDLHAADLIKELKAADPDASFTFLGGDKMAEASGRGPLIHYREMAYMGFVNVAMNLKKVLTNLSTAQNALIAVKPDCLILVDYPSFNLRLAETAYSRNIPVYYYISPKVWAWKENRVKTMKRLIKRIFSILPFETAYFAKKGIDVKYVGNPSLHEVDRKMAKLPSEYKFRHNHGLAPKPIIALLPGSRVGEIKDNLPVMARAVADMAEYQPVIAASPAIDTELYKTLAPGIKFISDATFELLAFSRVAVVTSGTATLEAALIGTPQIAVYRSVGSKIVYGIFERILKIDYVTLPNLIMNKEIIPELLMHHCTPKEIQSYLAPLLGDTSMRKKMIEYYAEMRKRLGTSDPAKETATTIVNDLKNNK
ncbi:MAG: lipid-A-disaccharide synthase [Muribaculaceae bacterium]|nr:lipid-A-disaccharide synthase [Muribaculaceae bacterium]